MDAYFLFLSCSRQHLAQLNSVFKKKGAHLSFSRCATKKTEAPGREQKTGIPKGRAEESKRESESNTLREQPKSAHIKNINKPFFIMCAREHATPSCSLIALSLPPLFEKTVIFFQSNFHRADERMVYSCSSYCEFRFVLLLLFVAAPRRKQPKSGACADYARHSIAPSPPWHPRAGCNCN